MAIYFPPLFCGKGSKLNVRESFEIEFDDGFKQKLSTGEICSVKDIIGYGYDLKSDKSDNVFRIMNSSMSHYFDIIEKEEPESVLNNFEYKFEDGVEVRFKKDFKMKDVVQIKKGQQFLHFKDTKNRTYHDLFSLDGKSKVVRMNNFEFEEYIEI
jgi:hypothetical protein